MFLTRFVARLSIPAAAFALALCLSSPVLATNVIIATPLGDVDVDLFEDAAPATVANFLSYVNNGSYVDSFIHRSVPGFVVQGGGFTFKGGVVAAIPTAPPVINEPGLSNVRGTIAMAKVGGNPNSATSQWFINLADNPGLDTDNGGFTVFGQVTGAGMTVIDAIAALPIWTGGGALNELPLINYPGSGGLKVENVVFAEPAAVAIDFAINAGLNDSWFNPDTAGQGFFITVFPDIGQVFLAWFTYDTERPDDSITANLGEPGHRWLTAFGAFTGNSATMDIEVTRGGVFEQVEPAPTQSLDGTIVLEFSDCENGTVTYDIPSINQQGVIPIQRIALDNVPHCEALAGAAD